MFSDHKDAYGVKITPLSSLRFELFKVIEVEIVLNLMLEKIGKKYK